MLLSAFVPFIDLDWMKKPKLVIVSKSYDFFQKSYFLIKEASNGSCRPLEMSKGVAYKKPLICLFIL